MNALGEWLGPRELSNIDIVVVVVFSIVVGVWLGLRGDRR